MKKIIVIDTSYTYNELRRRKSLNVVITRDLSNYFSKVISVHPLADLTEKKRKFKKSFFIANNINKTHTFYEFKSGNQNAIRILEPFLFFYYQIKMIRKLYKIIKNENINFIKSGDLLYAGLIS